MVCFMSWGLWRPSSEGAPSADHAAVDRESLAALRTAASGSTVACVERALHGLNHRHERMPREVESCIDALLQRSNAWPEALEEYGVGARKHA
ncbi:MAG: hypothetical protein HZA61_14965 [Candidatus Eisenbacteria bacterium]|uniref:Uncharacterized protein n=1 Tax=Eiseniibacteriota bacterium TaxID=2212470 RepID=A0A933W490_UNCEI|nr:hypothetical protein [Candidatus Eisenbacteria bacterium]